MDFNHTVINIKKNYDNIYTYNVLAWQNLGMKFKTKTRFEYIDVCNFIEYILFLFLV